MHEQAQNLPVKLEGPGTVLRAAHDWGNMSIAYAEMPAGTDLGPLLQGLADDACPCPHWGYMLKGKLQIVYTDGSEDLIQGGDFFYLPPGHTGKFKEDSTFVEFSPDQEYHKVLSHVMEKAGAAG